MEAETMLADDNHTINTVLKTRSSTDRSSRRKINWSRMSLVCLLVALVAALTTVAIVKWMPNSRNTFSTSEKKAYVEDIVFNAIFSTDFVLRNESEPRDINNIDDITNTLNTKLNGNNIRILDATFTRHLTSAVNRQKDCQNPLPGQLLQMNFITSANQCLDRNDNFCKTQRQKELNSIFRQLDTIAIKIQSDSNPFENVNIKLCNLMGIAEGKDTVQIRQKSGELDISPKLARINMAKSAARCSLCLNKLGVVQMNGEYGTRIQDDVQINVVLNDEQYQRYRSATVYDGTVYQLYIQLNCGDETGSPCSRSLSVTVWIDFNNNGLDDGESQVLRRSWSDSDIPTGAYVADIRIPFIDGQYIKSGLHTMRLTVTPSADYQKECGAIGYQESREYSVNIVPKLKPPVITTPAYVPPNPICSLSFPKIILVLMAGEKGTEIRDDIPRSQLTNRYQNQHHMAVTLFENTIYLIRIQLDCSTQLSTDLTSTGCNLAQDLTVSIDRNDDGIIDTTEMGTPYRWPISSYMAQGIYDLQVYVPMINDQYMRGGSHRMRIVVTPSDYYVRNCGYMAYNETREYSVNVIPFNRYTTLIDDPTPSVLPRDYECSSDVGSILLVVMAGEYRTQIRDDPSTRAVMNSGKQNQQHFAITLYEDTVYLLRIQLECTRRRGNEFSRVNCTLPHDVNAWIDLNDDGAFDKSENAAPYRWPLASYIPEGVYDLQIYVPIIDGRSIKSGPHRLRLVVTLNEDYRSKCGNNYYTEKRDYNVTIVRYTTTPVDTGVPYLKLSDNACSQTNSKIVLVIMTGEIGTHIRDDTPLNTVMRSNQNRHHLGVTLYENTIYRIRIQLDCDRPSSRGSYDENCNLAQDVNVFLDLNNDGTFDESESRVTHRWPLHNSMGLGIYDLDVPIPQLGGANLRTGTYRMRVVVMPSVEYQDTCGRSNYRETREYSVNIIPRTTYRELRGAYCAPGSLACSEDQSAIFSVKLFGERSVNIDDQATYCSSTNNYLDHSNQVVALFDNTAYTLYVELFCVQQRNYRNAYSRDASLFDTVCTRVHYLDVWIDFNSDGIFDESTERVSPSIQYKDDNRKVQYDLRIHVPKIDGRKYLEGQHRMRIVLIQDNKDPKPCHNNGYGEVRDYTVKIMPKPTY